MEKTNDEKLLNFKNQGPGTDEEIKQFCATNYKAIFPFAIKNVLKKVVDSGQKVYWFEVVEQRGAVKSNNIEFQTKLNIAVEAD